MMMYYRHLYEGEHAEIFPRAQSVTKEHRLVRRRVGVRSWRQVEKVFSADRQYIVANFSSLVAEVPGGSPEPVAREHFSRYGGRAGAGIRVLCRISQ